MHEIGEYLTIRETQMIELDIMKQFHKYCNLHNLRYCLAWGTLLGALRHKGFIPWDNDMDIFMSRPDMERLVQLLEQDSVGENIDWIYYSKDQNYHYTVVRLYDRRTEVKPTYLVEPPKEMGVWVDIAALDGFSRRLYYLQSPIIRCISKLLKATRYVWSGESKAKSRVRSIVSRLLPNKNHRYERLVDRVSKWTPYEKSSLVGPVNEPDFTAGQAFKRVDFEKPQLAPFEDAFFYIPNNPEGQLTALYGDYMVMPEEKDRRVHDMQARWKG